MDAGPTAFEELADGGILFESDGALEGLVGFGWAACAGEEIGAGGPVGLVVEEPRVGG